MYFFSFLLRLWLGFANFLCLFIFLVSFVSVALLCHVICLFGCIDSFVPVAQFCKRSMPLNYIFLFFCVCVSFANALCIFI